MSDAASGGTGRRRVSVGWAALRRRSTRAPIEDSATVSSDRSYTEWIRRYDTPDAEARRSIEAQLAALSEPPTVSVVMPVFNPPEALLRDALDSVVGQWYRHWELCAVDDGSTAPWVAPVLDEYARRDARIEVVTNRNNRHISAASNEAVGHTAGDYIAPLDHDDLLAPHALAVVALTIAAHPGAGLVYSDDDHVGDTGQRTDPYFKPDFDPVLLLAQNYVAHLCVLRRDLVEAVGGFREGFEGSQDWDLVLRVAERLRPEQVVHVPRVLYHWRAHAGSTARQTSEKAYAVDAGRRAVADHLRRIGVAGSVRTTPPTGFTRVLWDPAAATTEPAAVSIVMAAVTGDPLLRAVDSVLARTTWPHARLSVVVRGDEPAEVVRFLEERRGQLDVVAVEVADGPVAARRVAMFGAGAAASAGPVLCFMHDDVEVLTDRWLDELLGLLDVPGVGAVGAKLLAPGGAVRHFGYRISPDGEVYEPWVGRDRLDGGYFGRAGLVSSTVAASAAALVVRRDVYDQVGGHRAVGGDGSGGGEASDVATDVDFGRRLAAAGWRCALTPYAELVHHQCDPAPAAPVVVEGWQGEDPTSNPNLSPAGDEPAWPPRVTWPASA